ECDLQDQAVAYGRADSRYELNKRAVEDKNMGPLVKTIMTRCIQCTRCVRFAAEVAGVEELGMISRGESAEITTYLEESLTSELSGNVIDLCPVGALTSKPYAYNARPWELRKTESIDIMDAMGANIRVDAKGDAVMRILPVINEAVNEEWLSDKSRFIWDGLARQRLDKPYVRKDGKLLPVNWGDAFAAVKTALSVAPEKIGFVAGDLVEVEQAKAALDLARALGIQNTDCRPAGADYGASGVREQYILNSTLQGVEDADALFLVGTNPRLEAAVWNALIRKSWLWNDLKVYVIGEAVDLTYDYTHLGADPSAIPQIAKENGFRRPMVIVGESALARSDGAGILSAAQDAA
ncbi:MAG: molybdopterin-dependent oxidoreductase, partial [Pseudomonadota bacterium]